MWAHYADQHKGFCIGFNEKIMRETSNYFYSIKVEYQSDLPYKGVIERYESFKTTNIANGLKEIEGDILFSIIGTKYTNWKYERETRLVRPQHGTLKFDPKAVISIAF